LTPTSEQGSSTLIESFEQLASFANKAAPVVTMFSGGLDSSYLLFRLQSLNFTNVHAVAVDVGEPIDEAELTRSAAHFGATFKCLDGRELLVKQGVMPAIRATPSTWECTRSAARSAGL
jgi:argininosuccinate synthase